MPSIFISNPVESAAVPAEVSFTVQGGSEGTQPTFSGDPLFTGSYIKQGSLVHFEIQVDFDNITNFGTGQYYVELPFAAKYAYQFRAGCLHDVSSGRDYMIGGHVAAGETKLLLNSSDAQGQTIYDVNFTSSSPVSLSTADNFHVSGSYVSE